MARKRTPALPRRRDRTEKEGMRTQLARLRARGFTYVEIAKRLDIHERTARLWGGEPHVQAMIVRERLRLDQQRKDDAHAVRGAVVDLRSQLADAVEEGDDERAAMLREKIASTEQVLAAEAEGERAEAVHDPSKGIVRGVHDDPTYAESLQLGFFDPSHGWTPHDEKHPDVVEAHLFGAVPKSRRYWARLAILDAEACDPKRHALFRGGECTPETHHRGYLSDGAATMQLRERGHEATHENVLAFRAEWLERWLRQHAVDEPEPLRFRLLRESDLQ